MNLFRATAAPAGCAPHTLDIAPLIGVSVADAAADLEVMRRAIAFELSRLSEVLAVEQGFELHTFRQIKTIYARHSSQGAW